MWESVETISRFVDKYMSDEEKEKLMRDVYNVVSDGHYNPEFAKEDIAKMYYKDKNGNKHYAPYWPEPAVRSIYERHASEMPGYNFYDFEVTMNMIASDNWCMLTKWFPGISSDEMNEKVTEMAISWLRDDDWPTGTKIWDYLNK